VSGAPFLLIDAGNSRIKWSLVSAANETLNGGAFEHVDVEAVLADIADWSSLPKPASAWISNVAGPRVGERISALLDTRWPGLPRAIVRAQVQQSGVANRYTEPAALGSDRWCGMIGAHAAYPGENLLIATIGTATTLEALLADGTFTGTHTAQLPTLLPDTARRAISSSSGIFATDTRTALSSGCLLAQAGLIERAWQDLRVQWNNDVRLILSGGGASEVAGALKVPHTRHDSLVLAGLALIAREAAVSRSPD
jgi:type III pantothenate kinase